ncbi:MAG: TonB-dependent receptor [Deltaproteobacteria bacterium]|nr:TonB-dependent receptor [Deltaproteobacteria bacterium]
MHKRTFLIAVTLFIPFFSSDLFAQEREELMYWETENIITSATKLAQRLEKAPAIASVISGKEIRNMGARNLLDVLKRIPGMGVSIVTGYGKFGVESRGIKSSTSEKVLLMIDGHKVNESIRGTGIWHFGDMTVENIKQVEVIRGPGSAVHGANAFVAVINVVTKDAKAIDGADIRVGGGSFDTRHYNLLAGKPKSDKSKLEITGMVDYFDTNGEKLHVDKDADGRSGKTDGQAEKTDTALKVSYGNLSFSGRYLDRTDGGYIGSVKVLSDETLFETTHYFGELRFSHKVSSEIEFHMKGYYDEYKWSSYIEVLPEDSYPPYGIIGTPEVKNRTTGSEVQLDYSIGEKNTLTTGMLYEKIEQFDVKQSLNFDPGTGTTFSFLKDFTSSANWNRNVNRYVSALYLQDVWKITPGTEATLGVRHDRYSDFGSTTNPRLGLVWRHSTKTIAKILYGEAFRAPSFVELYNDNNPVQKGNADLKPEKIRTFEASLESGFFEKYRTKLTWFHSEIKDLIRERKTDWRYENLDEAVVDGIEAECTLYFNEASNLHLNYTYQNPREKDSGDRLPDVAAQKGNVGFNLALGRYVNANANLLVVGPRPRDSNDPREKVNGYEVVDLTLIAKNFFKNLEIRGSVYNLFDEKYADPEKYTEQAQRDIETISLNLLGSDFPREGRSFVLEARYKF